MAVLATGVHAPVPSSAVGLGAAVTHYGRGEPAGDGATAPLGRMRVVPVCPTRRTEDVRMSEEAEQVLTKALVTV